MTIPDAIANSWDLQTTFKAVGYSKTRTEAQTERRSDGRIYGTGSSDMKGGIAELLDAKSTNGLFLFLTPT
jgi:hypothetical protein